MTSALNDHHISFSSTLAATIGLEEAVLLKILCNAQLWSSSQHTQRITQQQLATALPFWNNQDIQRIANNLAAKGIIQLHSPQTLSIALEYSLSENTQPSVNYAALHTSGDNSHAAQTSFGARLIPADWQPNQDTLAQLAQHQIPQPFIAQQVSDFVLYWRERGDASHAWGSRFVKQVIRNWQLQRAQPQLDQNNNQAMHKAWRPSTDAVELLTRINIDEAFIDESVPEFVLYWQERGNTGNSWNSLFVKHVKRQWASYSNTLQYDTEPKPIDKQWQPSADALEVLQLANIDLDFARSETPSFVLFWLETKQAHSSWNSKYIQHVKYQWAKRHQININYANERLQSTHSNNTGKDPDFIRRHNDKSWTEGLY